MKRLLAHFGSLRTALVLMGLLAAVVLVDPSYPWLAPVMALMALNLVAALVLHARLRRQLPLLVSHLALLAVVLLAAVGRLASLDGRFELTEGVPFEGRLLDGQVGAWHRDRLHRLAFRHEGFEIDYAAGRRRGPTRNTVTWTDAEGRPQSAVIGDHRPLQLEGYRIYTSPNKGFAPVLRWTPDVGEPLLGAVHLPSFPIHELRQSNEWRLADGRELWVMLQTDETLIDPQAPARFALPRTHRLVVRLGDERVELVPGAEAALAGGRLHYEGLSTWMGYRITGDPTLPWLLAASLLAALALGWHYVLKFRAPAATPAFASEALDG
jgi:hypothetical protein